MSQIINDQYNVVIPAAGVGARFNSEIPKQYAILGQQTIIEKTLQFFLDASWVNNIIVALHQSDTYWTLLDIANDPRIVTVTGGSTRCQSVLNALGYLHQQCDSNEWVLVHDACRPYVSQIDVEHLINSVKNDEVGGLLALPSTDTLKRVDKQRVIETIPREVIWRAQTPQMFRLGLLKQGIEQALQAGYAVTDESSAIEFMGQKPMIVKGSASNIKITFTDDLRG